MDDSKTIWCGNLSDKVTEELLYELFLQAAPLERVKIPTDREGRQSSYAFITFKHEVSVNYALQLLNGINLFDRQLNLRHRNTQNQQNDRSLERNYPRNEPHINQVPSQIQLYTELVKMSNNLMQPNVSPKHQAHKDDRHGRWNQNNNYRNREDRYKEEHRPYKQHDSRQNSEYDLSNRLNKRNNFNRSGRRNKQY